MTRLGVAKAFSISILCLGPNPAGLEQLATFEPNEIPGSEAVEMLGEACAANHLALLPPHPRDPRVSLFIGSSHDDFLLSPPTLGQKMFPNFCRDLAVAHLVHGFNRKHICFDAFVFQTFF